MNEYYLRPVQEEDSELLLTWANDPLVRSNSFHEETISTKEHMAWFQKVMKDPNILIYLMMMDQRPVGQIRFQMEGEIAEIDYSIEASQRGKGLGKMILSLGAEKIFRDRPSVKRLVGKVKPANKASALSFEACGFQPQFLQFEYENK